MKINLQSKSAMTLAELIIASVLVGIITLGLVAAEQAVRMSRQSSSRDSKVSAQMEAAMLLLTKDASLTVGDATNTGIYPYDSGTDTTICFRQSADDVNSYADDDWICWWADKINGFLFRSQLLDDHVNTWVAPTSSAILPIKFEGTYTTFYNVVTDVNGKISHIQLTLKYRYDISKPAHPIENPDYELTANISPAGLSQ